MTCTAVRSRSLRRIPWQTVAAPDTLYDFSDGVGDPATTYYFLSRAVGRAESQETPTGSASTSSHCPERVAGVLCGRGRSRDVGKLARCDS